MFYLKHFFEVLKNVKLNGFFFVALSVLMVTSFHNRNYLKKVFSMTKKVVSRPYFNALITDKVNLSSVQRKMTRLPGVEKVIVKKTTDIGKELKTLSSELGSDFVKGLADLNYASVTVEMANGLQARSQSLIREYLTRLVGKSSVEISDIKKPKKLSLNKNDPYLTINNWGDFYILGILTVLWFVSCFSLVRYLKNYAYLIEKFQRKENVAMKIYFVGFTSVSVLAFLGNLYFRPTFVLEAWIAFSLLVALSWGFFSRKQEFKKLV